MEVFYKIHTLKQTTRCHLSKTTQRKLFKFKKPFIEEKVIIKTCPSGIVWIKTCYPKINAHNLTNPHSKATCTKPKAQSTRNKCQPLLSEFLKFAYNFKESVKFPKVSTIQFTRKQHWATNTWYSHITKNSSQITKSITYHKKTHITKIIAYHQKHINKIIVW